MKNIQTYGRRARQNPSLGFAFEVGSRNPSPPRNGLLGRLQSNANMTAEEDGEYIPESNTSSKENCENSKKRDCGSSVQTHERDRWSQKRSKDFASLFASCNLEELVLLQNALENERNIDHNYRKVRGKIFYSDGLYMLNEFEIQSCQENFHVLYVEFMKT
jgi:hypothetical protein